MPTPFSQVDAFTAVAYGGNPAAVCALDGPRPDDWMQRVAQEMNLSETAFFYPEAGTPKGPGDAGASGYRLRWFTPTVEVELCGHATLATSHVLWSEGHLPPEAEAVFHTRSGRLTARRRGDWIELNFPANPPQAIAEPEGLAAALGTDLRLVAESSLGYLVELASAAQVQTLRPDFAALGQFPIHGVIVTSRGDAPYDVVSRFFAPALGIPEDPVTGSAHCCLGPYWSAKLGKTELLAHQASARGGVVKVQTEGDRVRLGGQAITVVRGQLLH